MENKVKKARIPRRAKKKAGTYRRECMRSMIDLYRSKGLNPNLIKKQWQHTNYSESAVRIRQFEQDKADFHNANVFINPIVFWAPFLANLNSMEPSSDGLIWGAARLDSVPKRVVLTDVSF